MAVQKDWFLELNGSGYALTPEKNGKRIKFPLKRRSNGIILLRSVQYKYGLDYENCNLPWVVFASTRLENLSSWSFKPGRAKRLLLSALCGLMFKASSHGGLGFLKISMVDNDINRALRQQIIGAANRVISDVKSFHEKDFHIVIWNPDKVKENIEYSLYEHEANSPSLGLSHFEVGDRVVVFDFDKSTKSKIMVPRFAVVV